MTRHIAGLLFAIPFVALLSQVEAGFSCDDRVLDRFEIELYQPNSSQPNHQTLGRPGFNSTGE